MSLSSRGHTKSAIRRDTSRAASLSFSVARLDYEPARSSLLSALMMLLSFVLVSMIILLA